MQITMDIIKQLRARSGAGIADCKKSLEEAGGDIEKAAEILRKTGIAKAVKRGEREVCEGVVKLAVNEAGTEGYIVEVNAETDFVVRNEKFQEFADQALAIIKSKGTKTRDELMSAVMDDGQTVEDNIKSLSGVLGEKLEIKRCDIVTSNGTVAAYSHAGGKIGVLVALDKTNETELARGIAMHIAAADPRYIKPEDVPAEEIDKEKEIYTEQLKKEGKPENIIDKILTGKINKYFEEVCLIKQEYVKDDKKRVEEILGETKIGDQKASFILLHLDKFDEMRARYGDTAADDVVNKILENIIDAKVGLSGCTAVILNGPGSLSSKGFLFHFQKNH